MRITWQLYINVTVFLIIGYVFFNLVLDSIKDFLHKPIDKKKKVPMLDKINPYTLVKNIKENKKNEDKVIKEEKEMKKVRAAYS